MSETPSYDVFTKHPSGHGNGRKPGGLAQWMRELPIGEPQQIPEQYPSATNVKKAVQIVSQARRQSGYEDLRIAVRNIDGRVWACRLKPEDAKK